MTDAQRYQALKKFLLESDIVAFHPSPLDDTEPFALGNEFFGETFEAAVDTLAESREPIQSEIDKLAPRLQAVFRKWAGNEHGGCFMPETWHAVARAAIDREIDI